MAKAGDTAIDAKIFGLFGLDDRDKEPLWARVALALRKLNDDFDRENILVVQHKASEASKPRPKGVAFDSLLVLCFFF
jgi:hypothetical protein